MMGRAKKQYDDDDGRTIADMSQVDPTPAFFPRRRRESTDPANGSESGASTDGDSDSRMAGGQDRPWEDPSFTAKERRMYVLGAMKATLLIAAVYLIGLGIVIWLLCRLWN